MRHELLHFALRVKNQQFLYFLILYFAHLPLQKYVNKKVKFGLVSKKSAILCPYFNGNDLNFLTFFAVFSKYAFLGK